MRLLFPIRLKLPIAFLVRKLIGKKIKNTDRNRDVLTKKPSYPGFSCTFIEAQLHRPLSAWWRWARCVTYSTLRTHHAHFILKSRRRNVVPRYSGLLSRSELK